MKRLSVFRSRRRKYEKLQQETPGSDSDSLDSRCFKIKFKKPQRQPALLNNKTSTAGRRQLSLAVPDRLAATDDDGCNKRASSKPKNPYAMLYNGSCSGDSNRNNVADNVVVVKNNFNGQSGWGRGRGRTRNKFYRFVKKVLRGGSSGGGSGFQVEQRRLSRRQEKSPASNLVVNNELNRLQKERHRPSLIQQLDSIFSLSTKKTDDYSRLMDSMYAPLPSQAQLPSTTWFSSDISRQSAQDILKCREVGSFIVRRSAKEACFALSIKVPRSSSSSTKVIHYLIQQTESGFKIKGCSKEFNSLEALVTHHSVMKEKLPVPLLLARPRDDKQERKVKDYESIESLNRILDEMRIR